MSLKKGAKASISGLKSIGMILFPSIGKKPGEKYIGTWRMEPLTIAVLKSLTPPDVETELFDDRLELIDYDTRTDLVAIAVETYTAR